jgi:hypothetical protein
LESGQVESGLILDKKGVESRGAKKVEAMLYLEGEAFADKEA